MRNSSLPARLEHQANNVERDGHLNAARYMREAADILRSSVLPDREEMARALCEAADSTWTSLVTGRPYIAGWKQNGLGTQWFWLNLADAIVDLLAKTIGSTGWNHGDGSEDYDDDLATTLLNILADAPAREIYDALPYGGLGEKPAWLPGGNSTKQDEARQLARNELRSQSYTLKNTDKEG